MAPPASESPTPSGSAAAALAPVAVITAAALVALALWLVIAGGPTRPLFVAIGIAALGNGVVVLLLAQRIRRAGAREARFRSALDGLDEGLTLWDREGRLLLWNARCSALLPHVAGFLRPGTTVHDFNMASGRALFPDWSEERLAALVAERLAAREPGGKPFVLHRPDGAIIEFADLRTPEGDLVSVYRDVTVAHRAAAALTASEARLRDAIAALGEGFALWDAEDRLIVWNQRFLEINKEQASIFRKGVAFETVLREMVVLNPRGMNGDEREAWIVDRLRRRRAGERVELVFADGRVIEAMDHRHGGGGTVSIYRDVTEERRTLDLLRRSEARFRDAIASMGEGIALWDRDGRLLLWNQRYLEILPHLAPHARAGITLAELNRLAARSLHPEWSDAQIEALIERRLASRRVPGVPFELEIQNGRLVEIVDHPTAEGGHVSIFRDITVARRSADRIAASEARFRDGIENMIDGFVMWDRDDRILIWNRRLIELMPYLRRHMRNGASRRDVIVGAIDEAQPLWTPQQREEWVAQRLDIARSGVGSISITTLDGRAIEITDSPTSEGGGVTLYRDVTERERQARELERALEAEREASQQQRRFIAIASHEFRTPLAIIDGATQRLRARLAGAEEEVTRRLDRIRAAVARMTDLIDVTLSSSRLEAGRLELHPEPVDLIALLADLRESQLAITPDFAIDLTASVAALPVDGDPKLLLQVFANLLGNAIKYSGAVRRVELRAGARDGVAEIAVRDWGVGIPAEELPRLFTRFFRASTARSVPGTGIGLHFAREVMALHDGAIAAESQPGGGSTFTVRMRLRAAAVTVAAE